MVVEVLVHGPDLLKLLGPFWTTRSTLYTLRGRSPITTTLSVNIALPVFSDPVVVNSHVVDPGRFGLFRNSIHVPSKLKHDLLLRNSKLSHRLSSNIFHELSSRVHKTTSGSFLPSGNSVFLGKNHFLSVLVFELAFEIFSIQLKDGGEDRGEVEVEEMFFGVMEADVCVDEDADEAAFFVSVVVAGGWHDDRLLEIVSQLYHDDFVGTTLTVGRTELFCGKS
jgi:hypothetical protein